MVYGQRRAVSTSSNGALAIVGITIVPDGVLVSLFHQFFDGALLKTQYSQQAAQIPLRMIPMDR
jgi:hypothetical protein